MRGLPRTFWWLWTGALVNALASFVFPFLTLYLTSRGLTAAQAGLLLSLFGAGTLVAGPVGGFISDRYGRRPALLLTLFGTALAAVELGLVRETWLIAPGVLVFGMAAAIGNPALNAMVADVLPDADRERGFGLIYWAVNLGIGFSALVGGMLASKSWLGLFLADACTSMLFAAVVWRRLPETRPAQHEGSERGFATVLADRPFTIFLAFNLLLLLVFWQFQFALPIAMTRAGLSAVEYGHALALNCGLIICVQPLAAKAAARLGRPRAMALASLLFGLGYGAYGLCTRELHYLLATAVWSTGEVLYLPTAAALVSELSPPDLRGRYQAAAGLCFSLAMALAPIISGSVIDRLGLRTLWLGCLGVGALAALGHFSRRGATVAA